MKRADVNRVASMVLLSPLVISDHAAAQESAAEAGTLEYVVVTAQFRAEPLQEIPIAISALSAEQLEQKGVGDVSGIAGQAPNVALARGAGGFGQMATIFIRGVGQADPHFALEPGVGMYLDDVYYGVMTGAVFQLLDTDRIEVLRGPQGTLAGKNSIGGAIKLFSKRPSAEADGYAEVGYGSNDRIRGRAAGNVTLIDETLVARVSVAGNRVDGYVDRLDYNCATGNTATGSNRLGPSCKIGTEGGEETMTARASLRWLPSERIENTMIFDVTRDTSENPASKLIRASPTWMGAANYFTGPESYTNYENLVTTPSGPAATRPYVRPGESPLTASGISNELSYDVSDSMQLVSITAYRKSEANLSTSIDASPASVVDQVWNLEHEQFTQELRLSGTWSTLMDWTVGAYYYDADGESSGRATIPGGLLVGGGGVNLDTVFRDPVHTESESAFIHTVFHPFEKLDLIAAARYTDDSKEFTFFRYGVNGNRHPVLGALFDYPVEFSADRVDYRATVNYHWSDDLITYVQASTGFKGGGINPRPFFTTQALPFEEETLTAYELGVKSQLFDGRVVLNGAAFLNRMKDVQGTLLRCDQFSPFPGAPCAMTANIGDADIKGVELEAKIRPVDALMFEVSAGWLDFEYQDVNPATAVTLDMISVYTPEITIAAGLSYEIDLGNAGTLTPRVDYNYRSEIYADAVNSPASRLDSLGLLSARLTWRDADERWEASLSGANLQNEFYYESLAVRAGAPYFAGAGRPGRPREALLTVKRNFN